MAKEIESKVQAEYDLIRRGYIINGKLYTESNLYGWRVEINDRFKDILRQYISDSDIEEIIHNLIGD